jgi:hypothetical protein
MRNETGRYELTACSHTVITLPLEFDVRGHNGLAIETHGPASKHNTRREPLMEWPLKQKKLQDVLAEQRSSNELVKLIRKLRWMGMEDEAERVERKLARSEVEPADCVLAASRETD